MFAAHPNWWLRNLTVAMALSGCAIAPSPSASPAPAVRLEDVELELGDLALPAAYQRLAEDESRLERRPAEWDLAVSGEPTTNTCGEELQWVWLANAPPGSRIGDPAVRLFICTTPSVSDATAVLDSVPIEETVVPRLDGIYEAHPIPMDELDLSAEAASIACVWGEPDECRAWAYVARYDHYVVNASFVLAGIGGALGQEAFIDLVESIDPLLTDGLGL